ncbi:MAG: hypothetical protein QF872_10550, partial [Gammaproteobacteria bacterium]|nr:hypothetical protein [Gammaproteobacteria bacterium]
MTLMDSFNNLDYSSALESATEAHTWLAQQQSHFGHFVNGAWLNDDQAERLSVTNPATSEELASIELADVSVV